MHISNLISNMIKVVVLSILLYLMIWLLIYWTSWTSTKMSFSRALTNIEHQMETDGRLDQAQALATLEDYLGSTAYKASSAVISDVTPNDGVGKFLGQTISAKIVITWSFAGKDRTMTDKVDTINRGVYLQDGSPIGGYNTPHGI